MAAARFRDARQREAGQVLVAALTATAVYGTDASDALLDAGIGDVLFRLDPWDVAGGATTIIGKIVDDLEAVLGIDREATLAKVGAWVAAGELEEAP